MANLSLKAYKVKELNFVNNVNGMVKLKLSNTVSHNVRYNPNGTCEATMTVEAFDKENKDVLNIKMTLTGLFQIQNPETEKEFLHLESFKELYAFAKALTATVTAATGIPPIMLNNVDIENKEIYRFEMGKKNQSESEDN
ncbi:MAG: protein-export chaperone SecB [Acutalibacteraceae bacterium]